ncbi:MAG: AI-2E family transporter [Muribaculaceae bacterium]|nr:AI-2E family transporter [Muribaculaceae bacterium]
MWSSRPYTFDRVVRMVLTAITGCIILYFLYILRDVLLPFCVGALIAYIIEPWVRWNQRILRLKSHTWAVVLSTFEALVLLVAFCLVLIPVIEKEFSELAVLLDRYLRTEHSDLVMLPEAFHNFVHSHIDMDKVISDIERIHITELAEGVWHGISSGLSKILGLLGWLICFVYVLFILLDFDKYMNGIKNLIPTKYLPQVTAVGHDVSWTMKRYFRNQALISFITGICYGIGFSIVGIPMAVVIGLLNMVLFMVPYLVYISLIPVTAMCVFKSMETGIDFWVIWAECIAVYVAVEAFSDLVLTPHIMGKALGLNPAIIILALSVWGSLLGLLGMVLALPASTIIIKWTKIILTGWRDKVNASTQPQPPPN